MKRVDLSKPEFFFIVATRAILGAGVGLLAAGRLDKNTRRYVAGALITVGALATIPAVAALLRNGKRALDEAA